MRHFILQQKTNQDRDSLSSHKSKKKFKIAVLFHENANLNALSEQSLKKSYCNQSEHRTKQNHLENYNKIVYTY